MSTNQLVTFSYMDSYTWIHQLWPTKQVLKFISSLWTLVTLYYLLYAKIDWKERERERGETERERERKRERAKESAKERERERERESARLNNEDDDDGWILEIGVWPSWEDSVVTYTRASVHIIKTKNRDSLAPSFRFNLLLVSSVPCLRLNSPVHPDTALCVASVSSVWPPCQNRQRNNF